MQSKIHMDFLAADFLAADFLAMDFLLRTFLLQTFLLRTFLLWTFLLQTIPAAQFNKSDGEKHSSLLHHNIHKHSKKLCSSGFRS